MTFFSPRSMLYFPVTNERFLEKALVSGADAIVLDLEDSVPASAKREARRALAAAISRAAGHGMHVLVRVNHEPDLLDDDVAAAVDAGCSCITFPKCDSPAQLAQMDRMLLAAERRSGRSEGTVKVQALIESPSALFGLREIVHATPRLVSVGFGSEDLALELGVAPTMESMRTPAQLVVMAAAITKIHCAGLAGSVANYTDLNAFRQVAGLSRALGMHGASCIHPLQVTVLNEVFGASAKELLEARAIVEIYDRSLAEGLGACSFEGKMIDVPIANRARALLARLARQA